MKRFRGIGVLLSIWIVLRLIATQNHWIETYYSRGIYTGWRHLTHALFDAFPFSIGDVAYTLLVIYLIRLGIQLVRRKKDSGLQLLKTCIICLLFFQLSWGLNYHRIPYTTQWELESMEIDSTDLLNWTTYLVEQTNAAHRQLTADSTKAIQFTKATTDWKADLEKAYAQVTQRHPEFHRLPIQPKSSLYSAGLSYMGFSGYLNPFTLEAQTNVRMPSYQHPFTSAHEVAHQMGVANESECNLLAYLASRSSQNQELKYSGYATALRYALRYVHAHDSLKMRAYERQLRPGILANYQESKAFWQAHSNPLDQALEAFYDGFLKANNQTDGMESYSRFVPLALKYHKRFAPLKPREE